MVLEPEVLGEARYRLLDSIREYAAGRLADAGETAACQHRLRDYTVTLAEHNVAIGMARIDAPWSARVDVFRRYDVDGGNVLQVLSQCLADGDAETGLRVCTAVRPCWIVRGTFAEGGEWLDSLLAIEAPAVPLGVQGAALVGRAQLALPSAPALAESFAGAGLALCRAAGDEWWTAAALNLLSDIALHTGRMAEAAAAADEALSIAQAAGDGWNEGYALGVRAVIAALAGRLREAEQLAKSSISIMRRIDQQWGVARALLGLGDLARLRSDPSGAHSRYLEALAILREIDARPDIARCLAGLARVAMDLGSIGQARQHLAESLRLSHSTGSRIGVARGLEAFAALAGAENRPELAVQLAAAAGALREAAGFPPLSGARAERYLAPARGLGEPAIERLWAQGLAMGSDAAVALALGAAQAAADGRDTVTLAAVGAYKVAAGLPGTLTPRERQVAVLVASGRSNRAIADELVISPATAARHVANILAKLGFSSRAQIAAWATDKRLGLTDPAATRHGLPDPGGRVMTARPRGERAAPVTAGPAIRPGGPGTQPGVVSRWADLGGPLHYLDFGGPAGGPLIVCVHGLGGSAANWVAVAPLLTGSCRVLAPDLAGHGLTQSRGRGTGVAANRALLHRFLASVSPGPAVLMGNSMGGMISLLEASAHPGAWA